jgi:hypothetical protein
MKSIICIAIITLLMPAMAFADTQPPVSFVAALDLWRMAAKDDQKTLFDEITFLPVSGDNAPLARYTPKGNNKTGQVEIGQNIHRYKQEYIYLSSDQDMSTKPDFEQYLTVLMTLSLANESAHYLQDENGSLGDFYKYYNSGKIKKACALYSLQQDVSDIVMLQMGMRLEMLFLGHGSVKGLNALRIALEKNDLRDEFEDFRNAMSKKDTTALDDILRRIRAKRNDANMAGVKFCPPYGDAKLPSNIIGRATSPAGYPFETEESLIKRIFGE